MATIENVTVTFSLPENDTRTQNISIGRAWDGSVKFLKFRDSDRLLKIPLTGITTTIKNNLISALEGAANHVVTITPDSHIDLGAGSGQAVTAQWIDMEFNATKTTHDFWEIELNFLKL